MIGIALAYSLAMLALIGWFFGVGVVAGFLLAVIAAAAAVVAAEAAAEGLA